MFSSFLKPIKLSIHPASSVRLFVHIQRSVATDMPETSASAMNKISALDGGCGGGDGSGSGGGNCSDGGGGGALFTLLVTT